MSEDVNPMVVDFLLSRINFYYLDAYNKLASLDYPIHDYKSFCEQLPIDDAANANKLIQQVIEPHVLPIFTPQGGMETFHSALMALLDFGGPVPNNPRDDIDVPKEGTPVVDPIEIAQLCAKHARDTADRLVNPDDRTYAITYLRTYFDCIKKWAPPSPRPPRPEDFFNRR